MNKFSVRAFHESLGERPVLMNLSFTSLGKLQLENEEGTQKWEWSVDSLEVTKGGANNQLFLLTHKSHPGWMLYVREYDLIQEIKNRYPQKKLPRKNVLDTGISLAIAAVVATVVAVVALYILKDPILNKAIDHFPKKYEKKLGEVFINQMIGLNESMKFTAAKEELKKLLKPLTEVVKEEGYDFQVYISDNKDLNAFALPGGFIVFNRGMLEAVDDPEEILGVAAHEMAHVTQRHTLKQLVSALGTYAIFQIFLGDMSGIVAILADNSAFLLTRMYSRDAEKEADLTGFEFLRKANINPMGIVTFFDKLKAHEQKKLEELEKKGLPVKDINMSFLSTHPDTDQRIEYLKAKIESETPEKKDYIQLDLDLEKFKQMLNYQSRED